MHRRNKAPPVMRDNQYEPWFWRNVHRQRKAFKAAQVARRRPNLVGPVPTGHFRSRSAPGRAGVPGAKLQRLAREHKLGGHRGV